MSTTEALQREAFDKLHPKNDEVPGVLRESFFFLFSKGWEAAALAAAAPSQKPVAWIRNVQVGSFAGVTEWDEQLESGSTKPDGDGWVPLAPMLNGLTASEPSYRDKAQKLLDAAHDFWQSSSPRVAVRWLSASDDALVIFTRGEYRETLMSNIDKLPGENVTRLIGEADEGPELRYGQRAASETAETASVAACQSCGDTATRHVPEEATEHPGPYCDNCGPGAKGEVPAEPSADDLDAAILNAFDVDYNAAGEVTELRYTPQGIRALLATPPARDAQAEPSDSDKLHEAICHAVAIMNNSFDVARSQECREAKEILRQALLDYTEPPPAREAGLSPSED